MNLDLIAFWIFLGVVAVCVTWLGHRSRLETEKTIRQAIEKGVVLDAETIDRLRRTAGMPWRPRLVAWGIVTLALTAGIIAFAAFLSSTEPESVMPLLGIAAFFGCLGAGLVACGLWLGREFDARSR